MNQLSRAYVAGDFSLEELLNKLKVIDSEHRHFPISARIVSAVDCQRYNYDSFWWCLVRFILDFSDWWLRL